MAKEKAKEIAERIADECIAVRLRLLTRAVTRIYNRALRPFGLTVSQMNVLVSISYFGEPRQQDVCDALQLDKSSLSRDLERLRANGWVETLPGDDGRQRLLRITAKGRRLLERAAPAWQEAQAEALALIGERDAATLRRAAGALRPARLARR